MKKFDVLIIGTGVAGLTSAIKLAEAGLSIGLITRAEKPEMTNTHWAQGGIIYSDDKFFAGDIQEASSHTSSDEAIQILIEQSKAIVEEMLIDKAKTAFNRDENGDLKFTQEAAHECARIIYDGDHTGKSIQVSLLNYIQEKLSSNIEILTAHTAVDLITPNHHGIKIQQRYEEHKVVGAYVFDIHKGEIIKIMAKKVILATGGIGALYLHNTNAPGARGDGHAMARRAGAYLSNMEFVQFHPTAFYSEKSPRRFLISEALRGEGAKLVDENGNRFMPEIHDDAEMAPRDIVSRAIWKKMIELKCSCVYLDISHRDSDWIKERFPTIYEYCLEHKVDITKEPIPVVPAAHYTCGGVKTDNFGKTSVRDLYAVGEVACTGLHGANRLASTSLLEGLTWGYRAAVDILSERDANSQEFYDESTIQNWVSGGIENDPALIAQDWLTLKQSMWNYVGIIRSNNRLARAQAMFDELANEIHKFYKNAELSDELIGLRNAVEISQAVVTSSRRMKSSIGSFYLEN